MENLSGTGSNKASQPHSLTTSKQRRSGYEPSDTETEWRESPWHDDHNRRNNNGTFDLVEADKIESNLPRNIISPLKLGRRHSSKVEHDKGSPPRTSPLPRKHSSKSPYKTRRDDGRHVSPLPKTEHQKHVSPYKLDNGKGNGDIAGLNRKLSRRTQRRDERGTIGQLLEAGTWSQTSNFSHRSVTAPPRQRYREKDRQNNVGNGQVKQRGERTRTPSPIPSNLIRKQGGAASLVKQQAVGEINEVVADDAKISRGPVCNAAMFESIDSILPGDIFFSRDAVALAMQKNVKPNNVLPKPPMFAQNGSASHQRMRANGNVDTKARGSSSSAGLSQTTRTSGSAASRHSSGKHSTESSKISDSSGRSSSINSGKFIANRRKGQSEAWFACVMRGGPCRTSRKSPEKQTFDEASFIAKAFVVEKLRQFWADKHQPPSLNGFTCHKQEAQLLKQLVSPGYTKDYFIVVVISFYQHFL